jgi:LPS sulfotransferase NodH
MNTLTFIIVSNVRSGSTLLCNGLNSHPQINVPEIEPFSLNVVKHKKQRFHAWSLLFMLRAFANRLDGVKIIYNDFWDYKPILLPYIRQHNVKLIWVQRDDFVRQALSFAIAVASSEWRRNREKTEMHGKVTLDISHLVQHMRQFRDADTKWEKHLAKYDPFVVKYQEMTGGNDVKQINPTIAKKLCQFLDVDYKPLQLEMAKQNKRYKDHIKNWANVCKYIKRDLNIDLNEYLKEA